MATVLSASTRTPARQAPKRSGSRCKGLANGPASRAVARTANSRAECLSLQAPARRATGQAERTHFPTEQGAMCGDVSPAESAERRIAALALLARARRAA